MKKISAVILVFTAVTRLCAVDGLALLRDIPDNAWIKLPLGSGVKPAGIYHTNLTVDCDSGRVFFYGSETHGTANNNSIWYFKLSDFTWHQVYPDDPTSSYVKISAPVLGAGKFWAATNNGHPVPGHVFDAFKYIPGKNCILLLQCDNHNSTLANTLGSVGEPAAWLFDTKTLQWTLLKNAIAPNMFMYPMGVTPDGGRIIAVNPSRTYTFRWSDSTWQPLTTTGPTPPQYHTSMEYDTYAGRFVVVGGSGAYNYLSFNDTASAWTLLNNTGWSMNGAKIGYDTLNKVLIAQVVDTAVSKDTYTNSSGSSATLVRKSSDGSWSVVKRKTLNDSIPADFGFCFKAEYDLKNNVFYYMTGTDIWAYRYKKAAGTGREALRKTALGPELTVSPNPFSDHVLISVKGFRSGALVEVFSPRGQHLALLAPAVKGDFFEAAWNADRLPGGVYVVKASDGKKSAIKRILRN